MRDYVTELRKMAAKEPDSLYRELADYMNYRLIITNRSIFEYIPVLDGVKEGKEHLIPLIVRLTEEGFFGN